MKKVIKNLIAFLFVAISVALVVDFMRPVRYDSDFDINGFSRLPIQEGGRIKPIDTLARNSLMMISGKQTVRLPESNGCIAPVVWLMDVVMRPEIANSYSIFRIDNADVLGLLGWKPEDGVKGKFFSFDKLRPHLEEIIKQEQQINPHKELRNVFELQLDKLYQSIIVYESLMTTFSTGVHPNFLLEEHATWLASIAPGMEAIQAQQIGKSYNAETMGHFIQIADRYLGLAKSIQVAVVPPSTLQAIKDNSWGNVGQGLLDVIITKELPEALIDYADLIVAYRKMESDQFNSTLGKLQTHMVPFMIGRKVDFEVFFNRFQPFYLSLILYILGFVVVCIGWLLGGRSFRKTAFAILVLALIVHTFGLIARMYIQERPPVTNLYSSAIFVGWAAVIFGLILERVHKNGIGGAVTALAGFASLVIAHNLAAGSDTLEMMRAVLDSNFWLSTHVVVITMGYSAMFLMGLMGVIYLLGSLIRGKKFNEETKKSVVGMVYGTLCFATLFSFVGTMLGGIWADQSWGRFWGWDPKENGALLIILWCAIMLHAKWGKLIGERGLMVLAVFGNIVTSWSWFGTNMLGVGLHSYGFMDKAFWALMLFILSQIGIMVLGVFKRIK